MSFVKIDKSLKMKKIVADSIIGILRLKNSQKRDFNVEKIRKTSLQKRVLLEVYKLTDFPSTNTREELALLLGLPHRSIQVWFQNKRQKNRKILNNCDQQEHVIKYNDVKSEQNIEVDPTLVTDAYDIPTYRLIEVIQFCQEEEKRQNCLFFNFK